MKARGFGQRCEHSATQLRGTDPAGTAAGTAGATESGTGCLRSVHAQRTGCHGLAEGRKPGLAHLDTVDPVVR